jgi:hypothetical protein
VHGSSRVAAALQAVAWQPRRPQHPDITIKQQVVRISRPEDRGARRLPMELDVSEFIVGYLAPLPGQIALL